MLCPSKWQFSAIHCHKSKQSHCLDPATIISSRNVWVEHLPLDYGLEFHQEGQKIEVAFQLLPMASVQAVQDEPGKMPPVKKKPVKNLTPHLDPVPTPKWLILI